MWYDLSALIVLPLRSGGTILHNHIHVVSKVLVWPMKIDCNRDCHQGGALGCQYLEKNFLVLTLFISGNSKTLFLHFHPHHAEILTHLAPRLGIAQYKISTCFSIYRKVGRTLTTSFNQLINTLQLFNLDTISSLLPCSTYSVAAGSGSGKVMALIHLWLWLVAH